MASLYEKLQNATSEEDVKDLYIKALSLKNVSKNLIDIQTNEIWFEAKQKPTSTYEMFTQLLYYVNVAKKNGDAIPPFLAVIDTKKAAIMETKRVAKLLEDKSIKWGTSASALTKQAVEQVSTYIGTHFVSYNLETYEQEFITAVKKAINEGYIVRQQITPENIKQVFDKWVEMIGKEIKNANEEDLVLFFYADIMHDGSTASYDNLTARLLHDGGKPIFSLNATLYELASIEGYRHFWTIYNKPPIPEYRDYLLERRDSLILSDERSFKGAFYTPLHIVDKAYDYLNSLLGKNWQKNYIVWDMCCGVGNLEVKHSNHRNIYMSTLDSQDVDIMKSAKTCVAATRFQYDYLNDDINENGEIDYSLTNKIPPHLQKIIKGGEKKVLVLINPPYAEATSGLGAAGKVAVAKTKVAQHLMAGYGKASNELFTQFIARILKEIPNCTIAMFSTLKYVNAPNFEDFRSKFKAQYKGGFIVHSKAFDGLSGDFSIGFLVWQLNKKIDITSIDCEVINKNGQAMGDKSFYNLPKSSYLNVWLKRPRANNDFALPLSNAITVTTIKHPRVTKWSDNALAYMCSGVNDVQHNNQVFLLSSAYGGGNGMYVNKQNLQQVAVFFSVRKIIKPTWFNDRDQFLQPNQTLSAEFYNDCLIYMLFHGKNLTASANGLQYLQQEYSIVNHFIPFSEAEVGASDRFESNFMVDYISNKRFSKEAKAVLSAGQELWSLYFKQDFNHKIREELKLNRADVGWYQVRKALEHKEHISFNAFKVAYANLSEKILPQVYSYGFLKI